MMLNISRLCFSAIAVLAANMAGLAQPQIASANEKNSTEARGAAELRSAIKRIARRPTDADALIDAGNAALLLGDANAALNFFTRANALQPTQGRIKLGLATASVRTENPFAALRLFDEAVKLGVPERAVAADRALAFDLLGNFNRAQFDYNLARTAGGSNSLLVQQAVSLSLLGKHKEADTLLLPLLQQNIGDAWKARALLLAARGDYKESVKVVRGFMDARSARKIERYLRQMPRLTGAQQAAAIHLGHFPSGNIGRDSAAVQSIAGNYVPGKASGAGRLIPSGDPLGPKNNDGRKRKTKKLSRKERRRAAKGASMNVSVPAALARPVAGLSEMGKRAPMPIDIARERIILAETASANLIAAALPAPAPLPPLVTAKPAAVKVATVSAPIKPAIIPKPLAKGPAKSGAVVFTKTVEQSVVAPKNISPIVRPASNSSAPKNASAPKKSMGVAMLPKQQDSVPAIANWTDKSAIASPPKAMPKIVAPVAPVIIAAVAPAKPVAVKGISGFDLGKIVSSIKIPESEKKSDVVPVDLKQLPPVPAKVKPKPKIVKAPAAKKAEPVKPQYPARYWVQIATGGASAFPGDMRIKRRKYPDLFKGRAGWSSPWSKSSRLVVGPFANLKTAKKWEAGFRGIGGDGFVWHSGNGTKVIPLKKK